MKLAYFLFFITMTWAHQLTSQTTATGGCKLLYNGIDLTTKAFRVEVAPSHLFNYTPPEVKNDLLSDNLMSATGQLVQYEDDVAFHMNIGVQSLIAPDQYGTIEKGSMFRVMFIDGKQIELQCYVGSIGTMNNDKNGYVYPIGYRLTNRQIKQLQKIEIDKIGIQWSSGYEEYTIYEIDFFINQLACLQSVTKPN